MEGARMTTVNRKMSCEKILAIERQIQDGDLSLMDVYARDTLDFNRDNQSVLNYRKGIIRKYGQGTTKCLKYFGILSAMTNDRLGWDAFFDVIQDDLEPNLPFIAYNYMRVTQEDQSIQESWSFLLDIAAKAGHIYSRRIVFDKRFRRTPIVGFFLSAFHRIFIGVVALGIYLLDKNDLRLSHI